MTDITESVSWTNASQPSASSNLVDVLKTDHQSSRGGGGEPEKVAIASPEQSDSTEKIYRIILEKDLPEEQRELNKSQKLYYFPLAIGKTSTKLAEESTGGAISEQGSTTHGSENLLRELGRSLSQSDEMESSQEGDAKVNEGGENSTCGLFLNPGATLITNRLLKSGTLPDSITEQFNQLAKLNKHNVRSKRIIRTTTTRLQPVTCSPLVVSTAGIIDGTTTTASIGQSTCKSTFTQQNHRTPFHARFHSDETTVLTDYSVKSAFSSDSRKSDESPTTGSSSSSASVTRQPTMNTPPFFGRSPAGVVLRSKSSVSAVPSQQLASATVVSELLSASGYLPRSLPESVPSSRQPSGTNPTSTEGSTSSLPSIVPEATLSGTFEPQDHSHGFALSASTALLQDASAEVPQSTQHHDNISNGTHVKPAKRRHIMKELIQVEKDYVSALATLVNAYMIPLRLEKILDEQQLDVIFFKVNDLFNFHMSFLNTLQMWELTNTVGDKLLDMFSREAVAACYCSFVENFPNSEKILEAIWNTKSSFQRFCEQRLRTLRSKLPLKALLVQPVQRIPRYELLVSRLIEHTPVDYSDHALLLEAKSAIHRLAVRVNAVRADGQDEGLMDGVKLLERLLAPATLTPNRAYIRHDIVSMEDRKDPVCIFMFTDQIVFTVAKRRGSQLMKKPLFLKLQSPKGDDSIENIKYKIFHRLAIEAIDLEPGLENDTERLVHHRELRDKKDLALLTEIENISGKLDYRHHDLDIVVRQLYQSLQQELEDLRNARNEATAVPKNLSVFSATTKEGIERYELTFPTFEKRQDWERTVVELKRQLSTVKRTSKFHTTVEVTPTLCGIQLSCAAAVELSGLIREEARDVWICASDGYTGYICLLGLSPIPIINLNTPLSGCNSRITCICAVPGMPSALGMRRVSAFGSSHRSALERARSRRQRSLQLQPRELPTTIKTEEGSSANTGEFAPNGSSPISEDLTKNTEDDSSTLCQSRAGTGSSSPPLSQPDTPTQLSSSNGYRVNFDGVNDQSVDNNTTTEPTEQADRAQSEMEPELHEDDQTNMSATQEDDPPTSENTDSSETSDTPEETTSSSNTTQTCGILTPVQILNEENEGTVVTTGSPRVSRSNRLTDPHRSTMWIGTDDGTIFLYYATDNIKTSRQRQCISLSSSITSILHLDTRIFVACANGDLLAYDRHPDGLWNSDSPRLLNINPDNCNDPIIVRRMLAVVGNVWCAAHRFIYVLNSVTLKVELSFPLNGNPADPRGIQQMAYGSQTVWLATENSSRLSLYHATTGEFLMEIDLKPVVLQSLQHCDEIIKRHKEACLRVTCMTVCKDLLWVGTSAGIIVTVAIPRIQISSTQHTMEQPQLEVLKQGHIGPVRFILSLESTNSNGASLRSERLRNLLMPMPEVPTLTESDKLSSARIPLVKEPSQEDPKTPVPDKDEDTTAKTTSGENSSQRKQIPQIQLATEPKLTVQIPHHRHGLLGVRRASVNPCVTIATQMKVVSGGDGYEEYVTGDQDATTAATLEATSSTVIGEKDSYNYILIWDMN